MVAQNGGYPGTKTATERMSFISARSDLRAFTSWTRGASGLLSPVEVGLRLNLEHGLCVGISLGISAPFAEIIMASGPSSSLMPARAVWIFGALKIFYPFFKVTFPTACRLISSIDLCVDTTKTLGREGSIRRRT